MQPDTILYHVRLITYHKNFPAERASLGQSVSPNYNYSTGHDITAQCAYAKKPSFYKKLLGKGTKDRRRNWVSGLLLALVHGDTNRTKC